MHSGVLVLMGGGIDSSYLASLFASDKAYSAVAGVHFDYGQPGSHLERRAAQAVSDRLGIQLYKEALGMRMTRSGYEFKGRNLIFLFAAVPIALSVGFGQIAIGIHKDSPYYDASPGFLSDAQRLF